MWLTKRIIYLAIILLAIFLSIIRKKNLPENMRWVSGLLIITFCAELSAIILAYTIKRNSAVYMAFSFIQVLLVSIIYYKTLSLKSQKRTVIIGGSICVVVLVITSIFNKAWQNVNSEGNAFKSIFIIFLSLLLFTDWLRIPTMENILRVPMFWVNISLFVFFSVNIFFWMGYTFFEANNLGVLRRLEPIQYASNLLLYFLMGLAFYLVRPNYSYKKNE